MLFVEAIGVRVDKLQVNQVRNARFFSLIADECVDVVNIEELSVYCRWVEDGVPVEHFVEILPLKILMLNQSIPCCWTG